MLRGGGTLGVAESNEDRPPGGRVDRHEDDTSMLPFASTYMVDMRVESSLIKGLTCFWLTCAGTFGRL